MTVELFNSKQFEEALDHLGPYEKLGVVNGEFSYRVSLDSQSALMIRSSVKANDLSAGSSRDSIRVWLVDNEDKPLAAKTFKWVTRQSGWQDRLNDRMLEISKARALAGDCKECSKPKRIYKSRKGYKAGQMFANCFDCNAGFVWFDELKQSEVWFSEDSHGKISNSANSSSVQGATKQSPVSPDKSSEYNKRANQMAKDSVLPSSNGNSSDGDNREPPSQPDMPEVSGSNGGSSGLSIIDFPSTMSKEEIVNHLTEMDTFEADDQLFEIEAENTNKSGLAAFLAVADEIENEAALAAQPAKSSLAWSHYQTGIYNFVESNTSHGVVNGVAGCGKTTTNVHSLGLLNPNLRIKYAAFNKHIEIDIKAKAPDYVDVQTFHSWGFRNINDALGKVRFNQYKVYDIVDNLNLASGDYQFKATIAKLISLLKGSLAEPTDEDIQQLADDFCLDVEPHQLGKVRRAFNASVANMKVVDFDDMVYFPASGLVPCQPFDFIAVDEAQDMNSAQMRLAANSLASDGRMLIVGDPNQGIYAFRGAYVGIMDYMAQELNASRLPLSISYRAPLAIVDLVNRKYPHIDFEAAPDAIPGSKDYIDYEDFYEIVDNSHGVLCRTNAPLVAPCFSLIRQGRKATILGRNIGKGLLGLIRKREEMVSVKNLDDLLHQIEIYRKNEIAKFERDNKTARAALLDDQCKTVYALANHCNTIEELKTKCQSVFSDDREGVVFSTVHKAKGLEWDTVHILEPQLMPHPMARNKRDRAQEINIAYVADTRTKDRLFYVQGD